MSLGLEEPPREVSWKTSSISLGARTTHQRERVAVGHRTWATRNRAGPNHLSTRCRTGPSSPARLTSIPPPSSRERAGRHSCPCSRSKRRRHR
eukprot:2994738-Heterocapsa_arctica.AAC.1